MHDTLTVGIPVMVIILGIFMNRSEVTDLRAEMKDLRAEMVRRFDRVDAELHYFHDVSGKLTGRVEDLSKRIPRTSLQFSRNQVAEVKVRARRRTHG